MLPRSGPRVRRPRVRRAPAFGPVVTLDVGSSSIRVAVPGTPLVEEPSVVAVVDDEVVAAGWAAFRATARRSEGLDLVHPVCGGAPVHQRLYTELVRQIARRAGVPNTPTTVAISMPTAIRPADAGVVLTAVRAALPVQDHVTVSAPVAADLGAGSERADGRARLVVDVGHHLAEVAIVLDGAAIAEQSAWTGGADAMAVLAGHLLELHSLDPGPRSLQRAIRAASHPMYGNVAVRGIDTRTGEGRVALLRSDEVAEVLTPVFDQVADMSLRVLDDVPTRIAVAVVAEPVLLTGGMARVHGLRDRLARELGAPVDVLDAPNQSVADGLRRAAHMESAAVRSS